MTFALAYCDHVVVYRFAPRGQYLTDCEITWLVNGSAVEGKDYTLADLIWLWDVTTVADKTIIERNQAGVDSRFYEPGPLSAVDGDRSRRSSSTGTSRPCAARRAAVCPAGGRSLVSGRLRREGHD